MFVVAVATLLRAAERVPFHGDESEWISAGRYFRFVFLDHDVTSQVWRPSWLNRDQPPVGRYVIGGIVWASGTDPDRVNKTYAWEKEYAANLQEGRVPSAAILMPVRRTMAVLGALSVVLLFVVGRLVGGTMAGGVSALLATSSPLLQTYFVQARSEALLAFLSAVALVLLVWAARRSVADGRLPRAAWVLGPVLGLALATKLTAAVAIIGVCAWAGVAGFVQLRAARSEAVTLIGWACGVGLLAAVVWVTVNPFLWPDPVGRTWSMLEQQQSIMVEQGQQFGNPVDEALPGRLWLMVRRTFVDNSTPAFDYGAPPGSPPLIRRTFSDLPALGGVSVELTLAVVGCALLVVRAWRGWRTSGRLGPESALLVWLAAYSIVIGANLSLDWPRYYVPTAFFGSLLVGISVSWLWSLVFVRFTSRATRAVASPPAETAVRQPAR
ncbi:MAG: hypothetical protein U0893_23565 [Chloroflexota bacterium]